MELSFRTKEESNKVQQEAFLKLSKVERIYSFLWLMERVSQFPTKRANISTNNFIIEISK